MARSKKVELQPVFKLALEGDKETVLDETDARLLRFIGETNSLSKAAREVGISYRNAWDRVKRVERTLGRPIVETRVGGAEGGRAMLTSDGAALFQEFRRLRKYLFDALDERESVARASYKLSARNRMRARVTKVQKGILTAQVKMETLERATLTSIISNDAVVDLDLKEGDKVEAIVKSTEVIVGKDVFPDSIVPRRVRPS